MISYPDVRDGRFVDVMSKKLEFREIDGMPVLYPHQELVRRYMSPHTPYECLYMFHATGTGKTFICLAILDDHLRERGMRGLLLVKGNTARDSFVKQAKEWLLANHRDASEAAVRRYIRELVDVEHHLSFCNILTRIGNTPFIERYNNRIIIIDEAHNISPYGHRESKQPNYEVLHKFLHDVKGCKVLLLTATPMTDDSTRLYPLLNLMMPLDQQIHRSADLSGMIVGRISYRSEKVQAAEMRYVGEHMRGVRYPVVISYMRGYQAEHYGTLIREEYSGDIFRHVTHCSLFSFSDGTYGSRVVPDKLVEEHVDVEMMRYGDPQCKLRRYRCRSYKLSDEHKAEVDTLDALCLRSSKYASIIENIMMHPDELTFVFIEEIQGSGLLLFSSILREYEFSLYMGESLDALTTGRRYTICVGDTSISPNNSDRIGGFSDPRNMHGEYVSVILGSKVIGESITLCNVRHFHCAMPHWNESTVGQAVGRVVRSRSHDSLDEGSRNVCVYIHVSLYEEVSERSIDVKRIHISQTKEDDIEQLERALERQSIEKVFSTDFQPMSCDVSTFCRLYLRDHLHTYIDRVSREVSGMPRTFIDALQRRVCMPHDLLYEVLICMISRNTPIRDAYGRECYLREWGGVLTSVHDPSVRRVHYDTICSIGTQKNTEDDDVCGDMGSLLGELESRACSHSDVLEVFYSLRWCDKICFIERCIESSSMYEELFQCSIIAADDGTIYHVYRYRQPSKGSYSVSSRGLSLRGLTRKYTNNTWHHVSGYEEEIVAREYRDRVLRMEQQMSHLGFYGVLSTVDGKLRIRDISTDTEESAEDLRKVHRGRNITSLSNKTLERYRVILLSRIHTMSQHIQESIMRRISEIHSMRRGTDSLSMIVYEMMRYLSMIILV
jgi:superfamily II DNA or RNA helicase